MFGFLPFPPPAKHAKFWVLYLVGSIAVNLGLLLGLLLWGGMAVSITCDDVGQYLNARQSKAWPAVTGKILSSGTILEKKGFGVVVNYSYAVDGHEYTSYRLVFSARRPVVASEVEADKLLAPFGKHFEENEFSELFNNIRRPPDRSVRVYYDPASPQEATLRQEYFMNPDLDVLWLVVPISTFVIAIFIWSIRSWIKYIWGKAYKTGDRIR